MKHGVLKKIVNGEGYSTDIRVELGELRVLRSFINEQWRARLECAVESSALDVSVRSKEARQYHEIESYFNHKKLWPKSQRILGRDFVKWFDCCQFRKDLVKELGPFEVSDEESLGFSNFYWRICRPLSRSDVGPVHRDSWFWEANPEFPKPDYEFRRIKVWIPIYVERGLNGLMVEPFSYRREDVRWIAEYRDGIMKPAILESQNEIKLFLVPVENGQAIIFNDDLLHGGSVNNGMETRISLEFTALIHNDHGF